MYKVATKKPYFFVSVSKKLNFYLKRCSKLLKISRKSNRRKHFICAYLLLHK